MQRITGFLTHVAIIAGILFVAWLFWDMRPRPPRPVDWPVYERMARTLPVGDDYELVSLGRRLGARGPGAGPAVIAIWRSTGSADVCTDLPAIARRWPIAANPARELFGNVTCAVDGSHLGVDVDLFDSTYGPDCQSGCLVLHILPP